MPPLGVTYTQYLQKISSLQSKEKRQCFPLQMATVAIVKSKKNRLIVIELRLCLIVYSTAL